MMGNANHPDHVSSIVLLRPDWFGQYDGPLRFVTDGPQSEVYIPIGDDDREQSVHPEQAERMHDWTDTRCLVLADGDVVDHGDVTVITEAGEGDHELVVLFDSSQRIDPSDIDFDPTEARDK